jgi:hypothetical protein
MENGSVLADMPMNEEAWGRRGDDVHRTLAGLMVLMMMIVIIMMRM